MQTNVTLRLAHSCLQTAAMLATMHKALLLKTFVNQQDSLSHSSLWLIFIWTAIIF
jgi:hypothetical protein